jgi:hypothetical protein
LVSSSAKANFPNKLILAKKNYCFSMQDCIDGIISMMFSEIDDNTLECDDAPFHLDFAEPIESVVEKLKKVGIELYDIQEVERGDDSAIDDLLDAMGDDDNNEGDEFDL